MSGFQEVLDAAQEDAVIGLLLRAVDLVLDQARRYAAMARQRHDAVGLERLDRRDGVFVDLRLAAEIVQQPLQHRRCPLGQHSEALERMLNYFRRQPQVDKYAITT